MSVTQVYHVIEKRELLGIAAMSKSDGWRLVQISVTAKETYDLLYSFEKDYDMVHLRVELIPGEWIESVSSIFPYAFLYENEMQDLFGIDVRGMNLDFHGELYQTKVKAPLHIKTVDEGDIQNG